MTSSHKSSSHVSELEARAVAEASRETSWEAPSFVRELFLGRLVLDLIHPFPEPEAEEQQRAKPFLSALENFLREEVDAEEIERNAKIPQRLIDRLRAIGAFGIKIPREYGGLGLSQYSYGRAMAMVGTVNGSLVALLSAHQSIGVPQPLKLFGTEEQKKRFLPRLAKGAISAFALTESDVGSDPARMRRLATPTADGSGVRDQRRQAVVHERHHRRAAGGDGAHARQGRQARADQRIHRRDQLAGRRGRAALRVHGRTRHRERALRFTNVRVPKENLLWGEGKGLKLALVTLNTGRLTLPATCAAAGKWCLQAARIFAAERVQWGRAVGQHEAVAQMIADMAARTYAMEAIADLGALLGDAHKSDIRLEAAIAKLWNSDVAWEICDEAMQVKGGRGYEKAHSLAARGEAPVPLEQTAARSAHQPHLRGHEPGDATVHRARSARCAPARRRRRGDAGRASAQAAVGTGTRGPLLHALVPVALVRLGPLAAVR